MRIVFCGSGDVAVPSLAALCQAGHEIVAVLTQPPRKAGRGGKLTPTPTQKWAENEGLCLVTCPDINSPDMLKLLADARPAVLAVVDFGQKVGTEARALACHGAVNMHASLLPKLRGAAPINWAILRGHSQTGVTTFKLVDRMDAGPILLQRSTGIGLDETAEELRVRLAKLGAELMAETVAGLEAGSLTPRVQDDAAATRAPKLRKQDGWLDFRQSGLAIANRVRGAWPWPGGAADFVRRGKPPVRVLMARARAQLTAEPNLAEPGTIADDLTVNVHDGAVEVMELKVAGKRLMMWKDFVNGYRVAPGDRFEAPGGDAS